MTDGAWSPDGPVPGLPGWRFRHVDVEFVPEHSIDGRDAGWYTTIDVYDATAVGDHSLRIIRHGIFNDDAGMVAAVRDAVAGREGAP